MDGIDQLGGAMIVAAMVATPIGLGGARPAFAHPTLVLAGIGVGICSSVIPFVTGQLAMARLPRATFALMLALLPAAATVIGLIVLGQVPTPWTWPASAWSSRESPCTNQPTPTLTRGRARHTVRVSTCHSQESRHGLPADALA